MLPERILEFWFQELSPSDWWKKSEDLDSRIASEFSEVYRQAQKGELWSWRSTPEGRLAEIIVLDQFSRNIFRDKPEAFAQDILAVTLSCEAVRNGILKDLPTKQAAFALMPFCIPSLRICRSTAGSNSKIWEMMGLLRPVKVIRISSTGLGAFHIATKYLEESPLQRS